ncbi:hypothetical protein ACHQM5_000289 [Ranunculus cassubicifolius]
MEARSVRGIFLITMVVMVMISSSPVMAGFPHCMNRCKDTCRGYGCDGYHCENECFNNCLPGGPGSNCGRCVVTDGFYVN